MLGKYRMNPARDIS